MLRDFYLFLALSPISVPTHCFITYNLASNVTLSSLEQTDL